MLSQSPSNMQKKQKDSMDIQEFRKYILPHAYSLKKLTFNYIKIYKKTKKLSGCCMLTTEFC